MATLNNVMQSLTFEKIYLITQGLNIQSDTANLKELATHFKKFFNAETNEYISSCFNKYEFLRMPVHTTYQRRKTTGETITKVYYTNTDASKCILSQMGFDSDNLYLLFDKVDKFYRKYLDDSEPVKRVLAKYDKEYINDSLSKIEQFHIENGTYNKKEFKLLKHYWELYIELLEQSHIYMALSLLLLYSVLNAEVIHLVSYIEKTVKYNDEIPITDLKKLLGSRFVIRSALSSNLFLAHNDSNEPLSEEDTQNAHTRKMLFTVPKNKLNIENAIFKLEKVNPKDDAVEPDDNTLGGRSIEAINKTTTEIMKILISIGGAMSDVIKNRKRSPRYRIKAVVGKEEYYMQYIDWFKNSKIIFSKDKTKKTSWYIEKDEKRPNCFKICPYGDTQYHLLALDIPNATTKTFNIPLWLFPGNKTKAQRFMFYRVID